MNLEDIVSEINQTQKNKYCMIPPIWSTKSSQIYKDRKNDSDCQGMGFEGNEELLFNKYRVSLMQAEEVLERCWYNKVHIVNNIVLYT